MAGTEHRAAGRRPLVRTGWVLLLALISPAAMAQPSIGDKAPGWRLADLQGERVRFPRDAGDRTAIVLFWAGWCPYCKALMPEIAALQAAVGRDHLPVYALRLEETSAPSPPLPGGFRRFENAWDAADDYGVRVLPGLFVVRDGRILYRLDYPEPDHPSQGMPHGAAQGAALGAWWANRIRGVLTDAGEPVPNPAAAR